MNLLKKTIALFRRPLSLTGVNGWSDDSRNSDAGVTVNSDSVLNISAAWACVNLLAGTIGSLPLVVYRTDAQGARRIATDHPLYRLLHDSPNADQTALDFWEFKSTSLELWGNSYSHIERIGDRAVSLIPVRPDIMTVRRIEDGSLQYRWSEGGRAFVAAQKDMLHVRGFGGSPLGGLSTMAYGRQVFGLSTATNQAAASTFGNGMRPSGVLSVPTFMSSEQRTQARNHIAENFIGSLNAGRPFIAEGGMTWSQLAINPEDAQMLQSRGFSVEEVCRWFGVPPFMVGHSEKSTSWGTGLEQQVLGFVKFTLRRRLKRFEQAIQKQLLSPQDRAQGVVVEFNIEGLLRGDSSGRSSFYTAMLNAGVMTINEVRALENLPPVPGGDVPRMQMQNVPITQAGRGHNSGPPLGE